MKIKSHYYKIHTSTLHGRKSQQSLCEKLFIKITVLYIISMYLYLLICLFGYLLMRIWYVYNQAN